MESPRLLIFIENVPKHIQQIKVRSHLFRCRLFATGNFFVLQFRVPGNLGARNDPNFGLRRRIYLLGHRTHADADPRKLLTETTTPGLWLLRRQRKQERVLSNQAIYLLFLTYQQCFTSQYRVRQLILLLKWCSLKYAAQFRPKQNRSRLCRCPVTRTLIGNLINKL